MTEPFVFGGVPMPSLELSEILKHGRADLVHYLGEAIYANSDPDCVSRQRERMIATMRIHAARVGPRPTYLLRAPGRLNAFLEYMDLCGGDHISTTVDGDIPVAVSLRDDDIVTAVNAFPMFPPGRFSISDEIARFRGAPWTDDITGGLPDDWSSRTKIHPHYGHPQGMWLNYVRSPFLRIAWDLPEISLRGVDMTFGPSSLPLRTGMSSSSAIIVLAFLAIHLANEDQLPMWSIGEICAMLGEAEWYVGTRGGANDQTTILRNTPNGLLYNRHSKSPIECTPLPPLHGVRVVIANSLWEVSPHLGATRIVNQRKGWMNLADNLLSLIVRTVRQHLESGGKTEPGWLSDLLPDWVDRSNLSGLESRALWESICARYVSLGSLVEDLLGVPDQSIEDLIGLLPEEINPSDIRDGIAPADYPASDNGGYRARNAAEFFHKQNRIGRSIERLLKEAHGRLESGEITTDSEEYDGYRRQLGSLIEGIQASLRDDFQVSNALIDRMFEIAQRGPGFLGGKLMGAGTGGYTAMLVRANDVEAFCRHLDKHYYGKPENFAEYRERLRRLEQNSGKGALVRKAVTDMMVNLENALRYPSDQRRAVTFSRGACLVELDRFRE